MQTEPFNIALMQSSRLFGLPYPFALPFFAGTVIPLIWSASIGTAIWCALVYAACRWAAERDERIVEVFLTGSRAVPGTRSGAIIVGHSYGP